MLTGDPRVAGPLNNPTSGASAIAAREAMLGLSGCTAAAATTLGGTTGYYARCTSPSAWWVVATPIDTSPHYNAFPILASGSNYNMMRYLGSASIWPATPKPPKPTASRSGRHST